MTREIRDALLFQDRKPSTILKLLPIGEGRKAEGKLPFLFFLFSPLYRREQRRDRVIGQQDWRRRESRYLKSLAFLKKPEKTARGGGRRPKKGSLLSAPPPFPLASSSSHRGKGAWQTEEEAALRWLLFIRSWNRGGGSEKRGTTGGLLRLPPLLLCQHLGGRLLLRRLLLGLGRHQGDGFWKAGRS